MMLTNIQLACMVLFFGTQFSGLLGNPDGPIINNFGSQQYREFPLPLELVGDGECLPLLEVFFLVDVSSFPEAAGNSTPLEATLDRKFQLVNELTLMLEDRFPGVKTGFGTFIDKALDGFGTLLNLSIDPNIVTGGSEISPFDTAISSYCLQVHGRLSPNSIAARYEVPFLLRGGGADWQEAQLEAILRASLSHLVSWTTPSQVARFPRPVKKYIVVLTNSIPHVGGEPGSADVFRGPNPMYEPTDVFKDPNYRCDIFDYPTVDHVGGILRNRGITPIFLLDHGGWPTGVQREDGSEEWRTFEPLWRLAREEGNPVYKERYAGMQHFYEQLMERMGVEGAVEFIDDDLEDFLLTIQDLNNRRYEPCKNASFPILELRPRNW